MISGISQPSISFFLQYLIDRHVTVQICTAYNRNLIGIFFWLAKYIIFYEHWFLFSVDIYSQECDIVMCGTQIVLC